MPKLTRGNIKANQAYLKKWEDYQDNWVDSKEFTTDRPILLPITVDIRDGIMHRTRVKTPQLQTIMDNAPRLAVHPKIAVAVDSYKDFFDSHDRSQSGTPPTPLDFSVRCPVVHVFHLPRENWTFTDHTQYSVDNIPELCAPTDLFEVLGVSRDRHTLFLLNNNWTPDQRFVDRMVAETPKDKRANMILPVLGKFRMKYNLHVSIAQEIDGTQMRTDIIIDPGSDNDGRRGG